MNTGELSGATLAYLSDAVIELMVHKLLIQRGEGDVGAMNKIADSYVRASAQSLAIDKILPLLTEDELAVFKRGRNTHSHTVPKNAKVSDYRKATGMEALFAALYLEGRQERMEMLFEAAYGQ